MVQDQRTELQQMRQKLMESENGRQKLQMELDEERRKREALEKKYREMEEEFERQRHGKFSRATAPSLRRVAPSYICGVDIL
ncbi:MAG: hypothetical protein J0H65_08520 [Rhizobiales bacterium]|nr:hypothetical protein [Hyphomicrobiales bacterium]